MKGMGIYFDWLHALSRNGWEWKCDPDEPDKSYYEMTMLSDSYECLVRANVAQHTQHLCNCGHFGIMWLEIVEYECDAPYGYDDLLDMMHALEYAEDNLSLLGIPFEPDYRFHGEDADAKKKRNDMLRKELHIEEMEESGHKWLEEQREKRIKERQQNESAK